MKFGLMHDFSAPYGDWVADNTFGNFLEVARVADRWGLDSLIVPEHHFVSFGEIPSPMLALSAAATATQRIRLGTGVILMPLHHPVRIAEDCSVLDVCSKGRLVLGVGMGYRPEEYGGFGASLKERGAKFEESTSLVAKLLSDTNVTHSGRFYSISNVTVMPRPYQKPRPPIWIAAKVEKAVRRAARLGDSWYSDPVSSLKTLKSRMQAYRDELKKAGKQPDGLEVPLRREAYIARDTDTAMSESYRPILESWSEGYFQWGHVLDDGGNEISPKSTKFEDIQDMISQRWIIGGPDEFIAGVERYAKELGVNHFVLRMRFTGIPHRKLLGAIKILGSKVIPYFREA